MKCINKRLLAIIISTIISIGISGCGTFGYDLPYDVDSNTNAYKITGSALNSERMKPFAADICVADKDTNLDKVDINPALSGALFNRRTKETIYSKSVNEKLHPASTTKVMTALLALKYGRLDDIITASSNVEIKESGAQLCGFKEGDRATLDQVLNGLLIYSGNDAGIMIAEYISGSVEDFAKLMNEEAKNIGATNTYFVNPHGLTEDEHLVTAYDLYLIFNEALKYDKFKQLIQTTEYQSTYTSKDGSQKKLDFSATNRYITGKKDAPQGVRVLGGKTGTTKAAGACLVLYSEGPSGDDYISVIMHSETTDSLYENMSSLLTLVH